MELEIIDKRENKLLYRIEYTFMVRHKDEGTPNRKLIREKAAELLGVPIERVVVRRVVTGFGVNDAKSEIFVYESKDKLLEIEPRHILIRNGILEK
ncbi:MAG: 30S ribosomal protein S24e [Candidatus Njordarchaeales archaeon]